MASPSPLPPADAPMGESVPGGDWAATPFGPRDSWPPSLAFAVSLCLRSSLAAALYWGPERRLIHNRAWSKLVGEEPRIGVPAAEAEHSLWPIVAPLLDRVEASGEGAFVVEQTLRLVRDGIEEETYWNCHLGPIVDEAGRVAGVLGQANEVTKTVSLERRLSFQVRLADRLRGIHDPEEAKQAAVELLGSYLGAARVGWAEIDEAQGIAFVQRDWTRDPAVPSLAGQRTAIASFGEEALGLFRAGQLLAIPDIRQLPLGSAERTAAWEAAGVRALITVPLVREGALKALLYVHEPRPRFWKRSDAAIARDVAERCWAAVERARAEQHQLLLINELNHRVKNTLASVQGIAFQTLRGDVSLAEARARFEARLMALSGAHNLLTEESWGGASLERVVKDSIEHLAGEAGRFDLIGGEPLRLTPRAALALAMALHELGTNATKYGALSAEGGRVSIGWTLDGDRLRLEWRESGGPQVVPPTRRGFGSRLIERGLATDLGGAAALRFEPSGLRCDIEASLASIRAEEPAIG
ncbi:MAG TPA: HWE histidine kinase domain-containing protein [Allosphingosinicella sp.]|jgi:two-component sensor histidine kinase|nr:HWE histidine kinase domain-containing protein [Allosphingosinicella sp.]